MSSVSAPTPDRDGRELESDRERERKERESARAIARMRGARRTPSPSHERRHDGALLPALVCTPYPDLTYLVYVPGQLRACNQPVAVLWENVVPSTATARRDVEQLIGLPLLTSEGAVFEASRRRRIFASNLPYEPVPSETPNKLLQDVLAPGARALADKAHCVISSHVSGADAETVATAKDHSQRHRGRELVQVAAHSADVRGLTIGEMCAALGQSPHEVDAAHGETVRARMVGRSLAIGQAKHALGTLITAVVAAQAAEHGDGAARSRVD